ncbi:MAG: DUF3106 domain-containing protein [Usitatibacter sp.]
MAWQAAGLIGAALLVLAANAGAQTSPDRLKTPQTPFSTLAPEERHILGPIESEWERLPGYQQQRLISSARRYPGMQPIQKERFDTRLRGWASMSPAQRKEARETFQGLRKLPPARQHELRERWLQRHRPAEESEVPQLDTSAGSPQPPATEPRQPIQRREAPQRKQRPVTEAPNPR